MLFFQFAMYASSSVCIKRTRCHRTDLFINECNGLIIFLDFQQTTNMFFKRNAYGSLNIV